MHSSTKPDQLGNPMDRMGADLFIPTPNSPSNITTPEATITTPAVTAFEHALQQKCPSITTIVSTRAATIGQP